MILRCEKLKQEKIFIGLKITIILFQIKKGTHTWFYNLLKKILRKYAIQLIHSR